RERRLGHDRQLARPLAREPDDRVDGVLGIGSLACLREERAAHPVLSVHVLCADPLREERLAAPWMDRDLAAPAAHLDRVERVLDLLVERHVPVADRDREQLDLGPAQGEEEREDVVAGRVRIDDQRDRAHAATAARISSSSARVGRPGRTPSRSTMNAPAAQPKRTASSSSRPSASATANAALNASPAPVVSTARAANAGTGVSPSLAPRSPRVTTVRARAPATASASPSFGVT